jgi:hypothetical protein
MYTPVSTCYDDALTLTISAYERMSSADGFLVRYIHYILYTIIHVLMMMLKAQALSCLRDIVNKQSWSLKRDSQF